MPMHPWHGHSPAAPCCASGAAATAAALARHPPVGGDARRRRRSAGHLRRSSYEGLIGSSFTAGSVELRLLSVSDLAGAAVDPSLAGSEDAFALAFAGPLDAALEAGTHTLGHPALGTFELFVSPVERPRRRPPLRGGRRPLGRRAQVAAEAPPQRAAGSATAASGRFGRGAAQRTRLLRRVTLRRTARGARARVVLRPAVNAARVHGVLDAPRQGDRGGRGRRERPARGAALPQRAGAAGGRLHAAS